MTSKDVASGARRRSPPHCWAPCPGGGQGWALRLRCTDPEGVAGLRSAWLDTVFGTVTWLGSVYLILPATLAGMAILVRAQRTAEAALLWPRLNGA